jgi:capsular polysaccharide biosynthesis protein
MGVGEKVRVSETSAVITGVLTDTTACPAPVSAPAIGPPQAEAGASLTQRRTATTPSAAVAPTTVAPTVAVPMVVPPAAAVVADASPSPRPWMAATAVEMPAPCAWSGDLLLGEGLRDGDKRWEFQARGVTARAVNFRMRGVTLLPSKGLLCKDGQPIAETSYGLSPDEERAAVSSLTAGPHARLAGRRVFIGLNRFCGNYFHMLTQVVPAFAAYDIDPDFSAGILLLGAPSAALYRALRLAARNTTNDVPAVAVRPGIPIDIEDLTYSSFLNQCDHPSAFCRILFRRMAKRVAVPEAAPTPPAIYISRADSAMRPMRNEDELIATLARFGVVSVTLGGRTLDEQIILFRNARLIIGPHGAGLANLVFATPGTVVYELFPSSYISPCINRLAQMQGLHYWSDVHPAESRPGLWHHHTRWSVDIAHLERRLRDLRTVYGGLLR